ncbi:GNAT family N-acetyltransferase [Psychrobacillus sp. NPDC093200]|uniref:GNAT family N-acetyltransferase n=1 Tax=Psychrobacillus sp. NPDC093200 TaxID=3390656 RepID=UPI003D0622EE
MTMQNIHALDISYCETFSRKIDKPWGILFYNENQPNYYDANHARIMNACEDPQKVVEETTIFYQSKNIVPRFYIYDLVNQQNLLSELKLRNFKYEEMISPVQLWNNRDINIPPNPMVTIEIVTDENYKEALEIEGSIKEFGGIEVMEKVFEEQFNHPAFTHYLLRYDGMACSTACIFEDGNQARMESVATLEAFRGKGLIGQIIDYIQQEIKKKGIEMLWVLPINEAIEKVYQKYGFETVEKYISGHAFLSGKSIKEIQG